MKRIVLLVAVIALLLAVAILVMFNKKTPAPVAQTKPAPLSAQSPPPPPALPPSVAWAPMDRSLPPYAASGKKPKVLADPDARAALRLVGADWLAETYWVAAINDLTLPAKEREDLIEDLNEEGFANPKRITREDLPLIESRLEIIDRLAPLAIDDVNAAAFKEARKDLVKMREHLTKTLNAPNPDAAPPR